jgi:hypothetical protein
MEVLWDICEPVLWWGKYDFHWANLEQFDGIKFMLQWKAEEVASTKSGGGGCWYFCWYHEN